VPVAPHQLPHRRSWPDPGKLFVLLCAQHARLPPVSLGLAQWRSSVVWPVGIPRIVAYATG
jgi:hypothetical protein